MTSRLRDLVDVARLQRLTDELYRATGIPSSIISAEGEILTGSGWQRICTDFHRHHPEIARACLESDTGPHRKSSDDGGYTVYECPMGLVDARAPIVLDGQLVAYVFSGQILAEPVDEATEARFRDQARRFGLDEARYLEALREVPVFPPERFRAAVRFLAGFAHLVADLGMTRKHELEAADRSRLALLSLAEDHRMAAEALRRSEARFRELVENLNDVVYAVGLDGTLDYVSPSITRVLGFVPEEVVGRPYDDLVFLDDLDRIRTAFDEVIAGRLEPREYRMVHRDGGVRWVRTSSRPLVRDGAPAGLQGVLTDVTESHLAHEALGRSERLLSEAEAISTVGGWEYEVAPGRMSWTAGIRRIYGVGPDFDPNDIDADASFYPGEAAQTITLAFERAVREGAPYDLELPFEPSGGGRKWVRTVGRPDVVDGRVVRVVGTLMDITDRKLADLELEERRNELEWLLRSMSNAFVLFESVFNDAGAFVSYRFVFINEAYERITGVRNDEVRGRTVHEVWPGTEPEWIRRYGEVAVTGVTQRFEMYHQPTAKLYDCSVYRPWPSRDRFCVVFEDVTERRKAEEALRESEARYRGLFTSMAEGCALHEIILARDGRPADYRFLDANPAFYELTGLDPSILGRTVLEVLPATERTWIETYGRVAQTGEPVQLEQYSGALERWYEVRAFAPQPGRFATVFLDVTDRRRSEEERNRLLDDLRGMALRLSAAEEDERQRLARELHDRVGQNLTVIGLNLTMIGNLLPPETHLEIGPRLDAAADLLADTVREVRQVMADLRPPMLDDYGLLPALGWLVDQVGGRTGLRVSVGGHEPDPRLGAETELALFRIAQEALTNVVKHAAASRAEVRLAQDGSRVTISVTDDGRGFAVDAPRGSGAGRSAWGLAIMEERATAVGGELTVRSAPGEGTRVAVALDRGGP